MSAQVRLAGRLIEARVSIGQTQRGLSRLSTVEVSVINRIESAERMPSPLHLVKLLHTFLTEGLKLDEGEWSEIVMDATGIELHFTDGRPRVVSPKKVKLAYDPKGRVKITGGTLTSIKAASSFAVRGRPDPKSVKTEEDLLDAMRRIWQCSGFLSCREMESVLTHSGLTTALNHRQGFVPLLSKSTLNTMRRGETFPKKLDSFEAFLLACGLPPTKLEPWAKAWQRANASRLATLRG